MKKHVYPVLCNHCNDPACTKVCLTGATQQREDGIVWVDQNKCIGCRHCMISCPYQSRSYHSEEKEYYPGHGFTEWETIGKTLYPLRIGVVSKCIFCKERIDQGIKKGLKPGVDPAELIALHNEFLRSKGWPEETRLYAHGQGYDLVERPAIREDETPRRYVAATVQFQTSKLLSSGNYLPGPPLS